MTKWNTAETRNQNYSTMGSALVMLAFMSTGYEFVSEIFTNAYMIAIHREGWNQYMHD